MSIPAKQDLEIVANLCNPRLFSFYSGRPGVEFVRHSLHLVFIDILNTLEVRYLLFGGTLNNF